MWGFISKTKSEFLDENIGIWNYVCYILDLYVIFAITNIYAHTIIKNILKHVLIYYIKRTSTLWLLSQYSDLLPWNS